MLFTRVKGEGAQSPPARRVQGESEQILRIASALESHAIDWDWEVRGARISCQELLIEVIRAPGSDTDQVTCLRWRH